MTTGEQKVFTVRAERELIDAFTKACKDQDTTASREVRHFMRQYLQQHGQGDLFPKESKKKGGK